MKIDPADTRIIAGEVLDFGGRLLCPVRFFFLFMRSNVRRIALVYKRLTAIIYRYS